MNDRGRRLTAEDRRLTLVEAASELVRSTGQPPTTKAVAEAVGIAEGTIFRAYPTKEALMEAVVGAAVCPVPFRAAIAAIDDTLPLRDRLVAGTALLMQRFDEMSAVLGPMGMYAGSAHHEHPGCPDPSARVTSLQGGNSLLALVGEDADLFRIEPDDAVQALRMLAFAGSHHTLAGGRLTRPEEMVDLVLDGALRRPGGGT